MVASWLVARFPGGEVTGYHPRTPNLLEFNIMSSPSLSLELDPGTSSGTDEFLACSTVFHWFRLELK